MAYLKDPNAPATPRQKNYARSLGLEFNPDITMGEISAIIDEAQKNRRPSEAQLKLARDLGLPIDESTPYRTCKSMLDTELARRGRQAIRDNQALRAGTVIMHQGYAFKITFAGKRGKRYVVSLEPFFQGRGRHKTLSATSLAHATRATQQDLTKAAERSSKV